MSTKIYDIIDTENGVKFHVNRMLINNGNYVELIKMLNINNYDEEHLREILKLAQSAFDTTAAAYILERLKEIEKNINYEV